MSIETSGSSEERTTTAPGATAAVVSTAPEGETKREPFSLRGLLRSDLGAIPVFVALILIAGYFQIASSGIFLTPRNLTELTGQIITIGSLSLGAVLVLLIGEIDLSLAVVSALCGAIMGVLSARAGWPPIASILAALVAGAVIGALNGFFVSVMRMPSFIVTLAGLIAYQGLLERILEPQTTLPIRDSTINAISIYYLPDYLGIGLPILGVVLYALSLISGRRSRLRAGLPVLSMTRLVVQIVLSGVAVAVVLTLYELYRGVPLTSVILVGLIVIFWLLLTRTAFGRHVYAVGGSAEAARRAGINVVGMRIALFTLASMLAAVGGILEVSREFSAPAAPEATLLLNAIAAAVIGGVSLFGGRGSVWAVVLGALVVGSLINGLALLGQPIATEEMVEGVVLLLAVLADALLRRRNATGLR